MELNDQQKAFVYSSITGSKRALAGPGSGKTAALSHRIAYMIESGVNPENVLAVTFSKNMADELIRRIIALSPAATSANISTIHAMCYRLLREEDDPRQVGHDKTATSMNRKAKDALDMYGIQEIGWKDFLDYVAGAKSHGIRHSNLEVFYKQKIEQNGGIQEDYPWKNEAHRLIAGAHIEFDRLMKESGLITFSDMLCDTEWLLIDVPSTLKKYQERYQYILVDEAQDTSRQAMRILTMLARDHGNFVAIGDVDQTIYEFNGAAPEDNLLSGFEMRFPHCETFKLETNYRSTKAIVDFTNKAIDKNYTDENIQYRKMIKACDDAIDGTQVSYQVYGTPWLEAEAVVDRIDKDGWETDYQPGDYFICARTRAQLPYLYKYLFKNKIPFTDITGGSFWDMTHVQDVIAYLRLNVDRMNSDAFFRVYNKASTRMKQPFDLYDKKSNKLLRPRGAYVNHRWLGKAFLEACGSSWDGLYNTEAMNYRFRDGVADLQEFMRALDSIQTPKGKVQYIIDNCVRSWWLMEEGGSDDTSGDNAKNDDYATLIDFASTYESAEEFLSYVDDIMTTANKNRNSDRDEMVVLSTIHRLKGLERPVVYLIGLMQGLLPHRSINGMKSTGILPFSNVTKLSSERRLFFVAVSRAKQEIRLSGSWSYQGKPMSKSVFAYETNLVEEGAAVEYVEKDLLVDLSDSEGGPYDELDE